MSRRARELSVQLTLTPPFQPAVFIRRLADVHGLTITLVPFPMLGAVSGYTLRVSESEYFVYFDPDTSPKRLARVIYHEAGHIILRHVPISTPEQIKRFLATLNPASIGRAASMFRRQRFSLDYELDAEALAIALTALSLSLPSPLFLLENQADVRSSEIAAFYDELGL